MVVFVEDKFDRGFTGELAKVNQRIVEEISKVNQKISESHATFNQSDVHFLDRADWIYTGNFIRIFQINSDASAFANAEASCDL